MRLLPQILHNGLPKLLEIHRDFSVTTLTSELTLEGIRVQHVRQVLFTANVARDRLNRLELHGYILAFLV